MSEKEVTNVAEVVSNEKYYLEGEDFNLMAKRVGMFMGAAEKTLPEMQKWGEEFTKIIQEKKFIPGGRILANAGTYFKDLNDLQKEYLKQYIMDYKPHEARCGQMLNCYVIP